VTWVCFKNFGLRTPCIIEFWHKRHGAHRLPL
jgi:hypothetical protein